MLRDLVDPALFTDSPTGLAGQHTYRYREKRNMIIGISGSFVADSEGLQYVFDLILNTLASSVGDRVIRLPTTYRRANKEHRARMAREFLSTVDVVVGLLDPVILSERLLFPRKPPCVILALGYFPRGALDFEECAQYLSTRDTVICNCSADMELVRQFLPAASRGFISFPCADIFFESSTSCEQARAEFDIPLTSPVLLYTGRLTLEKNVHTLFRLFAAVRAYHPKAELILAGKVWNNPFYDLNIEPISFSGTIRRMGKDLGIEQHVHLLGNLSRAQLAKLYKAADLYVTMSLHHDENFGISPVEAMASSLPVIATSWGGFRDTVVDGVTGHHVPVAVSLQSPTIDWPFALHAVRSLLNDENARKLMGAAGRVRALSEFTEERFRLRFLQVVHETASAEGEADYLVPSAFADGLWAHRRRGPYKENREGRELYSSMIGRYAAPIDALSTDHLAIAAPCSLDGDVLRIEHPLLIGKYRIPSALRCTVASVLDSFSHFAVLRSIDFDPQLQVNLHETITWLSEVGALIATSAKSSDTSLIRSPFREPLLRERDFISDVAVVEWKS